MDCERFDKNSMDLLYGELDELSAAATMRHLHHCTRCRGLWGHLRTTRELSELPLESPPVELFNRIILAEQQAHSSLPLRERFSRTVSVLAGYAMRPQLAMAALLVLMIGSSLIFVRAQPSGKHTDEMLVVERGMPSGDGAKALGSNKSLTFSGDPDGPSRLRAGDDEDPENLELVKPKQSAPDEEAEKQQRKAYGDAMTAYQHGRYAEAERLFSEVASAGGEQAASAALHEGHAARNGSGCQRAAAIYDAVAARKTSGTISSEAAWHAASCYRAMGQIDRAVAHYRNLTRSSAFSERAQKALAELRPTGGPTAPVAATAGTPADHGDQASAAAAPGAASASPPPPTAASGAVTPPAAEASPPTPKPATPESTPAQPGP